MLDCYLQTLMIKLQWVVLNEKNSILIKKIL